VISANAADLEQAFRDKGIDVDHLAVDPSLPELELRRGAFAKWLGVIEGRSNMRRDRSAR
jgi:carbonic anhydrase